MINEFFIGNFAQTAVEHVGRRLSGRITDLVTNWYSYQYDGSSSGMHTYIEDGGFDMYDTGNQVSVMLPICVMLENLFLFRIYYLHHEFTIPL